MAGGLLVTDQTSFYRANNVVPATGEVRCPRQSCGKMNPRGNAFCYYCGALLRQPATMSPRADIPHSIPPARPRLRLNDNGEIYLTAETKWLGRDELSGIVPERDLRYISRQHVIIGFESGQYYVEDQGSTNGTRLNGLQIRGKGKYRLHHGDQIQLADVVTLTFELT